MSKTAYAPNEVTAEGEGSNPDSCNSRVLRSKEQDQAGNDQAYHNQRNNPVLNKTCYTSYAGDDNKQ